MLTWFKTKMLIRSLGTGTIRKRSDRVEELYLIHRPAVVPLIRVLDGFDTDVINDALRALARIGDRRAVPAIEALSDHEDELVREHASWALRVLHASDTGKTKKEILTELKELRAGLLQAVREREQYARHLLDACPYIALLVDPDAKILALNGPAADSLGYPLKELVGRSVYDRVAPEVLDRRKSALEEVIRTGRSVAFEDKRGETWFENFFEPVTDNRDRVVQVAIFARDITERKQNRKALADSHFLLDQQYRRMPIPFYSWKRTDRGWTLVDFNEASNEITSGRIARYVGRTASELHANRPDILRDIDRCVQTGKTVQTTMRYKFLSSGSERLLDVYYIPVSGTQVLVMTYDLTDLLRIPEAQSA